VYGLLLLPNVCCGSISTYKTNRASAYTDRVTPHPIIQFRAHLGARTIRIPLGVIWSSRNPVSYSKAKSCCRNWFVLGPMGSTIQQIGRMSFRTLFRSGARSWRQSLGSLTSMLYCASQSTRKATSKARFSRREMIPSFHGCTGIQTSVCFIRGDPATNC
jgi:hypothetical protein